MRTVSLSRITRALALAPLAALILLTGCRTYGDSGYESGPKMYSQMQQAVRQFEDDLSRAQADLQTLQQAADTNEALQPMLERFRRAVERHEQALASHRELVETLSASSSYRSLHRAYGAMTTDERVVRKVYGRTVRRIQATVQGTEVVDGELTHESSYFIEPTESRRAANEAQRLTMEQALRP